MKKTIILLLIVALCVAVGLTAYAMNKAEDDTQSKVNPLDKELMESLTELYYSTSEALLSSAYPSVQQNPAAFKQGYEAFAVEDAPYLIDYAVENGNQFILSLAVYKLHLYSLVGAYGSVYGGDVYSNDKDAYTLEWYGKKLNEFIDTAPQEVKNILDGDMTFDEKVKELDKYGMLAVPIIEERIQAGQTEWEVCLDNQLLSLSDGDRIDFLIDNFYTNSGASYQNKVDSLKTN